MSVDAVISTRRGRLTPRELAEAAVLADLAVLLVVLARLTPFAGLTTVVGAIPFAVLGMRHRARVLRVAFFVATILVFLLAGFSAATQVLVMALFGGIAGKGFSQQWSRRRTIAVSLVVGWSTVAGATVLFLAVFANLRRLNIDAARVQWEGLSRVLGGLGFDGFVDWADPGVEWAFTNWFVAIPVLQLVISIVVTLLVIRIGRPVMQRVDRAFGPSPEPSPELVALADQLRHSAGLTVVVGPNGSGKTTLLRAIAQAEGDLGRLGGTAMIGQRPESQVLAATVRDDVTWGIETELSELELVQVLESVGLVDEIGRETSALSGGQLQRLALASAILRRPRLLLSDESTAMIDPEGRRVVRERLRALADKGVTVVHVSHLDADLEIADQVVNL